MTAKFDKDTQDRPSLRKPAGIILMLLVILLWCGIAVTLIDYLDGLSFWLQLPAYIILGVGWIFPIRPLLTWMSR
ncbi:DUF2842 domain-containing protein [Parasphingorhabdus flavimaris]|uniref:DUF2842 domain-containing protein n=1 Tax=Parasphingorhabdus flavimaris TaxID=266812 RepID=A0ABX2N1B7_9SPHN|nr:DUF2842 domain-containing protein [Parasphingorhabdus flavimaris]NVD27496.1 DUF2842 domain-containing protein [Parasphingorhabdus flavimaris]|tara:strand:+ start:7852 stop:8076 length:225 start_codon:yes stop_codon:yes gene_type:complete